MSGRRELASDNDKITGFARTFDEAKLLISAIEQFGGSGQVDLKFQ